MAINTVEKFFVIVEHQATMFQFDYLNIFPSTAPKQCGKLTLLSNSKAVNSSCSFIGLEIRSGRMIDHLLRHTAMTVFLAVEIPV